MPSKYESSTAGIGYGEERKAARRRAAKAGVRNALGEELIAELAPGEAGARAIARMTRLVETEENPLERPLTQAEEDLRELLAFDDGDE